ncbi:MAG: hypothetical protein G01um101448_190 [Parcubacteria group bacterium Gr01-1014_48]|nr:MAG: hypothetical protein Greene041614_941 [Parcubacteria group bacterium Greene0416_14]TSC74314.1 MAG: hypothetical protein G01um101448_190 [Parcubacteria group bacterium Gr01-1014_48]TSD01014.1 MAG: hypothetical protein Greene101415_515 [Parcubacteria group bacterium Greene1014_15]TSD07681.1 MAG: hypothetical protein Greene07144_835 [Parcubacteria group bacterium Greene0714_4]
MKRRVIGIIFFLIIPVLSACVHQTYNRTGLHGTRVTVVRQFAQRGVACMLLKDGKPAAINQGGQWVTIWLTRTEQYSVVGARTAPSEPEYGRFVLQLACYAGTEHDLLSGHASQVMQRPVCQTAPIRYEYGPYTDEKLYVFGSPQFPCYTER